jgi:AhpD family alkylhydroperoxidase
MENLNERELALVALGASIGSNCIPCTTYHIKQCKTHGLSDRQIRAAVAMAVKVKNVPAQNVLSTAEHMLEPKEGSDGCAPDQPCSCC